MALNKTEAHLLFYHINNETAVYDKLCETHSQHALSRIERTLRNNIFTGKPVEEKVNVIPLSESSFRDILKQHPVDTKELNTYLGGFGIPPYPLSRKDSKAESSQQAPPQAAREGSVITILSSPSSENYADLPDPGFAAEGHQSHLPIRIASSSNTALAKVEIPAEIHGHLSWSQGSGCMFTENRRERGMPVDFQVAPFDQRIVETLKERESFPAKWVLSSAGNEQARVYYHKPGPEGEFVEFGTTNRSSNIESIKLRHGMAGRYEKGKMVPPSR